MEVKKVNSGTKKMVTAALLAALVCIATMIIKIPTPFKGYVNLGDSVVLTAGWLLPPFYGFLAAALGSSLADFFSGYALYAPATFVIKGIMAVTVFYGFRIFHKKLGKLSARMASGVLAELLMVLGYLLFEGVLYGFAPALLNVFANGVQGAVGLVLGILLMKVTEKVIRL